MQVGLLGKWFARSDKGWNNFFLSRWFGQTTLDLNKNLVDHHIEELHRIKPNNLHKFVQGFQRREDITDRLKKVEYVLVHEQPSELGKSILVLQMPSVDCRGR